MRERSRVVSTYERGIAASTFSSTSTGVAYGATACGRRLVDRPGRLLARAVVVDRGRGGLRGEHGHGRRTLDHDVRLDQVALAFGKVREIQQALAVRGHERRDEHEGRDVPRAVRRSLRDDDAAHAVADENRPLGAAREHAADPLRTGCERDVLDRSVIGAAAGQVERVDRVPSLPEWSGHGLPAPRSSERAVDEDEARHSAATVENELALGAARLAQSRGRTRAASRP